jgi:hypothetical protein
MLRFIDIWKYFWGLGNRPSLGISLNIIVKWSVIWNNNIIKVFLCHVHLLKSLRNLLRLWNIIIRLKFFVNLRNSGCNLRVQSLLLILYIWDTIWRTLNDLFSWTYLRALLIIVFHWDGTCAKILVIYSKILVLCFRASIAFYVNLSVYVFIKLEQSWMHFDQSFSKISWCLSCMGWTIGQFVQWIYSFDILTYKMVLLIDPIVDEVLELLHFYFYDNFIH